jgi:hypothetical protein
VHLPSANEFHLTGELYKVGGILVLIFGGAGFLGGFFNPGESTRGEAATKGLGIGALVGFGIAVLVELS